MLGITKDTLLIAAATLVLLGPWQAWFFEQGLSPKPTMKKKRLSTVLGTFAGDFAFAKLRIFLLKFIVKAVSLNFGSFGLRRGSLLLFVVVLGCETFLYSSNPVVVVLSKGGGAVV